MSDVVIGANADGQSATLAAGDFVGRMTSLAIAGLLTGLIAALGMSIVRIGFSGNGPAMATAVIWLAFLLFAPLALLRRAATDPRSQQFLVGPSYLLAFVVVVAASYLGLIGTVLLALSIVLACVDLRWARRPASASSRGQAVAAWIALLVMALLFTLELAGTKYGSFIADLTAEYGRASNDIYYHWSLANALRWFGAVGIGVDGIVPVAYYPSVHLLAVRLAEAAGSDIGLAFIALRAIFLAPLMLVGFAGLALVMDRTGKLQGAWALAVLMTISLTISVLHRGTFDSESFVLGLLFFAWGATTLMAISQGTESGQTDRAKIAAWLTATILVAITCVTKSSVGLILLCLAGYVALRIFWRRPAYFIGLGALLTVIGGISLYLVAPRGTTSLSGGSIAENFHLDNDPIRPLVIYGAGIVAIALAMLAASGPRALWSSLRAGREMRIELLLGCVAAATIPALVFAMVDRGARYFTDVQIWFGAAVLIATIPPAADRLKLILGRRRATAPLAWAAAPALFYLLPILLLAITLPDFIKERGTQAISASLLVRTGDLSYYTDDKKRIVNADAKRGRHLLAEPAFWHPAISATPLGPLVGALRALRGEHGTRLAAYAPPTDTAFWNLRPSCPGKPLTLFALAAVPLLDGLPPLWSKCAFGDRAIYGLETIPARTSDNVLDEAALCKLAATRGFSMIYRIESLDDLARNRLVTCP
jgi:hypothetical protein